MIINNFFFLGKKTKSSGTVYTSRSIKEKCRIMNTNACSMCLKIFFDNGTLKNHLGFHLLSINVKMFQCKICDKKFAKKTKHEDPQSVYL